MVWGFVKYVKRVSGDIEGVVERWESGKDIIF